MSKSKNTKYNDRRLDREYMDGEVDYRKQPRKKDKRIERALRTMNIEELVEEEGFDPEWYDYIVEEELEQLMEKRHANV
jgi:hypothetical protein